MTEQPNREVAVLNAALELPPGERAAYLDNTCAGETALRQRVEELLRAHEQARNFLEAPPTGLDFKRTASPNVPLTEKPGDKIGRYKLLQQIGEGGCGVVYMAEQEEPVRRRVALKIIKLGMDTKQVIARFEAERQALALMDHPNIAKVFDAGVTEGRARHSVRADVEQTESGAQGTDAPYLSPGRPYFVMELVRGVKITEFCDENKLSTEDRLKLFIQVCQAIQHAHQKGIIHRDIKPSNILVTINDGVPVPKVIDFGIAKATAGRLTDLTLFTAFEQFIGTPAYMSPEQAVMTSLDIDTRSDIYSLGVLLYELLTGRTPFDQNELLAAGLDEMRRTIREKEPLRPSNRLSTLAAEALTTTANHRQTEPPKLIHVVRGDLDWIVMKCLEKDCGRRYETANGLARDIQRHLSSQPVLARPPSRLYEFQKTVRRHKFGFAATAAIIVVLATGVFGSAREAIRARRAEKEQIRLREAAQNEAAKSRQVAQFLQDMLAGVGPEVAKGRDTTVLKEILDKTVSSLNQLTNQPAVEADLQATLGGIYEALGDYTNSIAMDRRALDLRKMIYGEEHPLVADSLESLASALGKQSRFEEAETLCRQALALERKLLPKGTSDIAQAEGQLGTILFSEGKYPEAESLQRDALAAQRALRGSTNAIVAGCLLGLAITLDDEGKYAEAERLAREGIAIHEALHGRDDPNVAHLFDALGMAEERQGKYAEAENAYGQGLAVRRKLLGDSHPDVGWSFLHLGMTLSNEGKVEEAEQMSRNALSIWEKCGLNDDSHGGRAWSLLMDTLVSEGKYPEAEDNFLDQLQRMRKAGDRVGTAQALNNLAWVLATTAGAAFRTETNAVRFAEECVALTGRTNSGYLDTLAAAYANAGEFAKAVNTETEAMALLHTEQEEHDYASRLALYQSRAPYRDDGLLAQRIANLLAAGKPAEAEPLARDCVAIRTRQIPDDWLAFNASAMLGRSLLGQGKYAEAEARLLSGYKGMKEREDKIPPAGKPRLRETVQALVELYERTQQPAKAALWKQQLAELDSKP